MPIFNLLKGDYNLEPLAMACSNGRCFFIMVPRYSLCCRAGKEGIAIISVYMQDQSLGLAFEAAVCVIPLSKTNNQSCE